MAESAEAQTRPDLALGFLADAPVTTPDQDRLGRAPFARMLAESILKLEAEDGFVFALYGGWGAGKSSALNFVEHYLGRLGDPERKPVIMRFNPWWFSGKDQLLLQFFDQMRLTLGRRDVPQQLQDIGNMVRIFGRALTPLTYLPGAGGLVKLCQDIAETAAGVVGATGKQKQLDVWGLRRAIGEALRGQDRRIVIIIDDIDRLAADEIRQMFRLIKAIADFPKTVYLLGFDRRVVAKALEDRGVLGEEYLEKVVQAPFDLPLPDRESLRAILAEQLKLILSGTPAELEKERWLNLCRDGIDPLMQTPRDVKRYVNAVRPAYAVLQGEANPLDLLGIEAVRVFAPDVYQLVHSNERLFVQEVGLFRGSSRRPKEEEERIYKSFLEPAPEPIRQAVNSVLAHLFPRYARVVHAPGAFVSEDVCRKGARICNPDYFALYFSLALPQGLVSNAEARRLLSLSGDPEMLAAEMVRLAGETPPGSATSRLRGFLEWLDSASDAIPVDRVCGILQALCHAGDKLLQVDDKAAFFDRTNYQMVISVLGQLLPRFEQEQRFEIMREVTAASKSMAMAVHLVHVREREHKPLDQDEPRRSEAAPLFNTHQLAELRQIATDRIRVAATEGSLQSAPGLAEILFCWRDWAGEQPVSDYLGHLLASDEGLADFVAAFLNKGYSYTARRRTPQIEWEIDMALIAQLVDTTPLQARAERILAKQPCWLDCDRQRALKLLVQALQKRPVAPAAPEPDV